MSYMRQLHPFHCCGLVVPLLTGHKGQHPCHTNRAVLHAVSMWMCTDSVGDIQQPASYIISCPNSSPFLNATWEKLVKNPSLWANCVLEIINGIVIPPCNLLPKRSWLYLGTLLLKYEPSWIYSRGYQTNISKKALFHRDCLVQYKVSTLW